ncbi:MAG: hypothetical protein JNK00_13125 [Flavipsychrobacter sp.]|nr:hypothetical protein [Flavipsychrobacter sp.]
MSIPDLNGQAYNSTMMQNLISSLREGERLDFLKSMPAITAYTLNSPEGFPLTSTK